MKDIDQMEDNFSPVHIICNKHDSRQVWDILVDFHAKFQNGPKMPFHCY